MRTFSGLCEERARFKGSGAKARDLPRCVVFNHDVVLLKLVLLVRLGRPSNVPNLTSYEIAIDTASWGRHPFPSIPKLFSISRSLANVQLVARLIYLVSARVLYG